MQKAANLSVAKGVYTLTKPVWASSGPWNPHELDEMWSAVERGFGPAVDALISSDGSHFDARPWLFVLVEFAAQIFVRGTDFASRFVGRINRTSPELTRRFDATHSDYINGARVIELHRLRGAIPKAEWTILHPRHSRFITNDLARTPVVDAPDRVGYVIPLRADAALMITFGAKCSPPQIHAAATEDRWVVEPIKHEAIPESRVARLNALLTYTARHEIYGGSLDLIASLHASMSADGVPLEEAEPTFLAPFRDVEDTRRHESLIKRVSTLPSQHRGS
jgi:hypothetical protein